MFSQLELVNRKGSSFQSVQNKLPRTPRTQVVAEVAHNFSNERASLLLANSHLKGQLSRLPVGGVVDHRKVESVLKNEPSILNMDPIFSFAVQASAKGHGVEILKCAKNFPCSPHPSKSFNTCFDLEGRIESSNSGLSFWATIEGVILRRIRVFRVFPNETWIGEHNTFNFGYKFETRLCRPGDYILNVRIDFMHGQGTENCSTGGEPRETMGFYLARKVHFTVTNKEGEVCKKQRSGGEWVRTSSLLNKYNGKKSNAYVWISHDHLLPWTSPGGLARSMHSSMQSWGLNTGTRGHFWMHWHGDSVDLRGPITVLIRLRDGLLETATNTTRITHCQDSISVRRSPPGTWSCGKHHGVSRPDSTKLGLSATGYGLNLWSWVFGPGSAIHLSFVAWIGSGPSGATNFTSFFETTVRKSLKMPPLPHVIILHYGLQFKMSYSDDEYRKIVEKTILMSLSNLRNGLASRRRHDKETLRGKDYESVLVWRRVSMTHFDGTLPQGWKCRSPERLYALDDCAMQVGKAHGLKVFDALSLTEMRPDATRDNRHYDARTSNVPFFLVAELFSLFSSWAPPNRPPLFHLHIPMTGGTSFYSIIRLVDEGQSDRLERGSLGGFQHLVS
ncbi:hypothetical protein T484DRAFT_1757875 [Baffinella frigidus]|nr:hypothetical protein T484DRAFT_1757875 [Cryptophyta sp. CCMP2293]